MNALGYIVTDRKLKNINGFVEQVNDISLADAKHPNYTSILDKQLDDNVFWTFNRSESRSDLEEDLEKFYDIVYNNILNKIKYYYINIFKLRYSKIKKIYDIVFSLNPKTIYISNGVIYIPYDGDILGVSLDVLEYCGIKREKIIKRILSNPNNRLYDDGNKFIFKLTKRLGNKKYAVPYFISS